MKTSKVEIENFMTIGSATLELDNRGLLLIQGQNNDDTSTDSNGAGKSSIPDAVCWANFGVTARKVTGDAVVNRKAKKDCRVSVTHIDGDKEYVVTRYRKHSAGKNSVTVSERDLNTFVTIDLTKGTDKETQDVINSIIGCSVEVFMSAVYAGQERMPDLPGMTDKMLKTLIEEAAGVEVLTEAYSVASKRFNAAAGALATVTASNASLVASKARMDLEMADLLGSSKDFETGRRDRAKTELAKTLPINSEIARVEEALAVWDEAGARKEMDELVAKIGAHNAERDQMKVLNLALADALTKRERQKFEAQSKKTKIEALEKALTGIHEHVGKPCGECGKPYHAEDLETAKKMHEEAIAKGKAELRPMLVGLKSAAEAAAAAQEAADKFAASMTDISAAASRQVELSNLINSIEASKRRIDAYRKEIDNVKLIANSKLSETNPWTKAIESLQGQIDRNDTMLATQAEDIKKKQAEADMLADAVKVFGPAGVRAHILDTVTPYLNDRTQEYLGALADGNIHATWSTLSKTAKGELREKFNIEVTNDKGAESFDGLSGGEKRKVRLATAMALQDMVAARATKPIGLFVGDEIDDALDEAGLERLMGVLERKAKEKGTVLIISHNSLSDWVDQVITVEKNGGMSTVTGDTVRTV